MTPNALSTAAQLVIALGKFLPTNMSLPRFPDFLGIGAQKCATTWLYRNLRAHPDIFLPATKELHFFDNDFSEDLTDYLGHFRDAGSRIRGEITPSYGFLDEERIEFIRRQNPDLRIILQIRNPIERAWSHAVMDLCTLVNREVADVSDDEFRKHFASSPSRDRGAYLEHIDRWLGFFPSEQLHLSFMEQVTEDPKGLLASLFRFLGATSEVHWSTLPYNKKVLEGIGGKDRIPPHLLEELRGVYRRGIDQLYERLGDPIAGWRT